MEMIIQHVNGYGIAWMETEPNGIILWKSIYLWIWNNTDGIDAERHYIMETDMDMLDGFQF